MNSSNKVTICKRCSAPMSGKHCSNCGMPIHPPKIDRKYIISEIGRVVNLERGIFYTVKELLLRPGHSVRLFILEDRNRLVKPFIFTIVCAVIYTLVQRALKFNDGYLSYNFDNLEATAIGHMLDWVSQNYGYANIIMTLFIAMWLRLFFNKYKYNFYEIIILLCYVIGMNMLMFTVFGLIESLVSWPALDLGVNISFIYTAWAIGKFFDGSKKLNYAKAFLSYFLGMATFILVIFIIGATIQFLF